MKQWSMFIGRWQPWHEGHQWLIAQRLNEGKNVWIAIRDVEKNDNQPWSSNEILMNLQTELRYLIEEGRVMVSIVPDIESINYGRGVGYDIIEHTPPDDIKEISATKIRKEMRDDGKL
tara:strand:- start:274 stop:627 length:354 start_codon:yes stop_codon:yes gene_type:complete